MDLSTGLATLRCGPRTAVNLSAVPRAIREAGFEPEDLDIIAAGEFDRDGDEFTPLGWGQGLTVRGGVPGNATPRHARILASVTGWEGDSSDIGIQIEAMEPAD